MIKFQIEDVEKAESPLDTIKYQDAYERMVLGFHASDFGDSEEVGNERKKLPHNIITFDRNIESVVYEGRNPFFNGLHIAYAEHRPFIISPDMIWLLICQGFAKHVNLNSEKLRHLFVDFSEKMDLVVSRDDINIDDPNSSWEELFPSFTQKIGSIVGDDIIDILTSDFSTTTNVERVASQITIMETVKSYFQYQYIEGICGIPELTLEGNVDDWKKLLLKTKSLGKFKLNWWVRKLTPLLEKFIEASSGTIDKKFWMNIFKYHCGDGECGNPDIIDGWILNFYPYDRDGNRLKYPIESEMIEDSVLPDEILKVDLKYVQIVGNGKTKTTPLELWAGFVGLDQQEKSLSLKPHIGWMVRKADSKNIKIEKLKLEAEHGIEIRVKEIPEEIRELGVIDYLSVVFIDGIRIPYWLGEMKINRLFVEGKSGFGIKNKLLQLLPETEIWIGGKQISNESGLKRFFRGWF